jgi:hypothetical protein
MYKTWCDKCWSQERFTSDKPRTTTVQTKYKCKNNSSIDGKKKQNEQDLDKTYKAVNETLLPRTVYYK